MIHLEANGFSIVVPEDNPIYRVLSVLDGETIRVSSGESTHPITQETPPEKTEEKNPRRVMKTINREEVWDRFYAAFGETLLHEDNTQRAGKILRSHLDSVLEGEVGSKNLEEVEENLYKNGDLYLYMEGILDE